MSVAPVVLAAVAVGLAGCGSAPSATEPSTITVSAAASLTDAFTEAGARYEELHPGVAVRFNFAGSSALAEQMIAGAPVDVFAAASTTTMDTVAAAGLVDDPTPFASNTLAIAVPPANQAGVDSITDLADPDVSVVVCAAQVPCGAAAQDMLVANGIALTPVSLEPDVRSVLTKVIADEVDAGIVYRTDIVAAGGDVQEVPIPDASNVRSSYPIAAAASAGESARDFIDFVLSDDGQEILAAWGFGSP